MTGGTPTEWSGLEEESITARAAACGIILAPRTCAALAAHSRAVMAANDRLHLTTVVDPEEFLERHIGEGFEGASLLAGDLTGALLDIGTGSGFPALALAAARAGLGPIELVEASAKKAAFLESALASWPGGRIKVLRRQVQRAADLPGAREIAVLTCRAVGGWFRLLPKLAPLLAEDGVALLWAGPEVDAVRTRVAWRRLRLLTVHPIPQRDRSMIWMFRRA